MRHIVFIVALLLVASALSSTLLAQDLKGKLNISPYAGFSYPIGDFADDDWEDNEDSGYRKTGLKFGAAFEYYFNKYFGAGIHFKYVSFPSKDYDILDEPDQDDKITVKMFGVHGKFMFLPEGVVRPYGKFGIGIMMWDISDFPGVDWEEMVYEITDIDLDSKPYIQVGAGIAFFASPKISIFGELTLDNMRTDGAEMDFEKFPHVKDEEIEKNYNAIDFIAGINIWFGGTK